MGKILLIALALFAGISSAGASNKNELIHDFGSLDCREDYTAQTRKSVSTSVRTHFSNGHLERSTRDGLVLDWMVLTKFDFHAQPDGSISSGGYVAFDGYDKSFQKVSFTTDRLVYRVTSKSKSFTSIYTVVCPLNHDVRQAILDSQDRRAEGGPRADASSSRQNRALN